MTAEFAPDDEKESDSSTGSDTSGTSATEYDEEDARYGFETDPGEEQESA